MHLVILLEVDMGKNLSYGLFLAVQLLESTAGLLPSQRCSLPETGTRSCECALVQDSLKHMDGPGWRPQELGPVSAGGAELSVRFCLGCYLRCIFQLWVKGCTFVLHHLCILSRRKQHFATLQPEKGLSPPV